MKVAGITMVRNEADILEASLRYNLQFLDEIHVVNHLSTDATVTIVESLISEGLPVRLAHETGPGHIQDRVLTGMMRSIARAGSADLIVPLDADEFLKCGHGDVRAELETLPQDAPSRIPWQTYVPTATDLADEPHVLRRITHRLEPEAWQYYKVIVPAALARDTRYRLGMGSHCLLVSKTGKALKNMPVSDSLALAHFPVRSQEQITSKVITGWLAVAAKPDRAADECHHWKIMYERITTGQPVSDFELGAMAINYVAPTGQEQDQPRLQQDPLPAGDERQNLRYTEPARVAPLALLADAAEKMAAEVASLKRQLDTSAPARRPRSLLRRLFG